ncbi:MAG TPA: hypothetical protein VHM66_05720 [Solirubrobacterales bacterium]|nr:hypothetical protein [Solirubrobacterales bacterium]
MRDARPGEIIRLGGVEGTFVLPNPASEKLLLISAGSGVTPIMSMIASLARSGAVGNVVHIHSARTADRVIFGERLRAVEAEHAGFDLHLRLTAEQGRIAPTDLDALCPDWRRTILRLAFPGGEARPKPGPYRAEQTPAL